MKHFINLSSCVLNKLHIVEILKRPSKYNIYMSNSSIDGTMIFSMGSISSKINIIEICEKTNKQDYDTITNLIKEIE